jgi:hypothetical protein
MDFGFFLNDSNKKAIWTMCKVKTNNNTEQRIIIQMYWLYRLTNPMIIVMVST